MKRRGLIIERQLPLPAACTGVKLDCGYRLAFLFEKAVVLEFKALKCIEPIHEAQVLTFLKLGG